MNLPPKYDDTHVAISEEDAIVRFHPERLKRHVSEKISKTQINLTRWEVRPAGTPLAVLHTEGKNCTAENLCWWNGEYWVYITSFVTKIAASV